MILSLSWSIWTVSLYSKVSKVQPTGWIPSSPARGMISHCENCREIHIHFSVEWAVVPDLSTGGRAVLRWVAIRPWWTDHLLVDMFYYLSIFSVVLLNVEKNSKMQNLQLQFFSASQAVIWSFLLFWTFLVVLLTGEKLGHVIVALLCNIEYQDVHQFYASLNVFDEERIMTSVQ